MTSMQHEARLVVVSDEAFERSVVAELRSAPLFMPATRREEVHPRLRGSVTDDETFETNQQRAGVHLWSCHATCRMVQVVTVTPLVDTVVSPLGAQQNSSSYNVGIGQRAREGVGVSGPNRDTVEGRALTICVVEFAPDDHTCHCGHVKSPVVTPNVVPLVPLASGTSVACQSVLRSLHDLVAMEATTDDSWVLTRDATKATAPRDVTKVSPLFAKGVRLRSLTPTVPTGALLAELVAFQGIVVVVFIVLFAFIVSDDLDARTNSVVTRAAMSIAITVSASLCCCPCCRRVYGNLKRRQMMHTTDSGYNTPDNWIADRPNGAWQPDDDDPPAGGHVSKPLTSHVYCPPQHHVSSASTRTPGSG